MRQIIVIISQKELRTEVQEMLKDEFSLIFADSEEEGRRIFEQNRAVTDAVLLDLDIARRDGIAALGQLRGSTLFETVPLIGVSRQPLTQDDARGEYEAFYDLITTLSPSWLNVMRIRNAIRSRDTISYGEMEKMLGALPVKVFLKDDEGRYVFATSRWSHLKHENDPGWTIRGKTDREIRINQKNAEISEASDRRIIESGQGESYTITEQEDGKEQFLELVKSPTFDEDGSASGIIALVIDVTERYLLRNELEKLSSTDTLTNLLNRRTAEQKIRVSLEEGSGRPGYCALLMIDADNFKKVNDTFGHAAGDRVLSVIGKVICENTRATDIAGRMGGDEFIMLLSGIQSSESACSTASRIIDKVKEAFAVDPIAGYVSLSIGIAMFPEHGMDFDTLYRSADSALYDKKMNGKDGFCLFGSNDSV